MLFVGDDWYGSNATSLRDAFTDLGLEVLTVNTFSSRSGPSSIPKRLARKIRPAAFSRRSTESVSEAVRAAVRAHGAFDYLFVFKGIHVSAAVVSEFRGLTVHYHPDDTANLANVSDIYSAAEPHYDTHVTTKLHNVGELRARTKSDVIFVRCAYDPRWHFADKSASTLDRVGLVGTKRPDRIKFVGSVAAAASNADQRMLIAGSGWSSEHHLGRIAEIVGPKFGAEFSLAVHSAPIQLGVLNSANRDSHTCRSFEVPAAGGLFVGEWSAEHDSIFSEQGSALLYRTEEEAIDMIRFALLNEEFSSRTRAKGLELITNGKNTYVDRAREILSKISQRHQT